jgi:hypothetical protein
MSRCDAAFRKSVVLACCDALEREGFARLRREQVQWPLGGGFHCWVGLNTALNPEVLHVNPFVGVHVEPIERLWTSYKKGTYTSKYDRSQATYARHMGEIVPDVPAFRFVPATDIASEAQRLARLFASFGLEFAKGIADYETLLPLLRQRIEMLGANPERVASCLYLMGRKVDARQFVEEFLPTHEDYFSGFALPFLKMLDEGD